MAANKSDAEILLNYPPLINGATQNVIPNPAVPPDEPVRGAPKVLFTPVLNQQGVLANAVTVLVDPPPRDGPGDDNIAIELLLNGQSLENRQIPAGDRDKRTEFNLFESLLIDGRNNRLEYKVHRPGGNVGDSTPLWVLYSAELPGGNVVPGDDDHPYLDISLPAELGDPPVIGKDDVDRGVPLTVFYPFMKDHDVITVELRRERFTQKVLPGQAGQPVIFILTRAMFESAGNSAAFAISFTVIDQLNNYTDRKRWSKMLRADVDVDRVVLNAPILREDPNDVADDPAIVDRDKLKGGPLLVVVLPEAPVFEVGDRVEGRFTSTPSGVDIPFSGTIEKDGFGRFNPCIMEIPNSNIVLDDQVRAAFTLSRNGVTVGGSKTAVARVIGAGAITLNPPTLVLPATSPIDVLAYANGVTVRVTFAGNSGDKAQLKELNPAPGAVPFPEQDFIAGQSDFTLSPAFLAARQGQDIELTWVLIRGGIAFAESSPLLLKIERIADGDVRLPRPSIAAVTDGLTLDLNSFTGDTTFLIDAWPGIAVGQWLWARCEGKNASGSTVTEIIYDPVSVPSTGGQSGPISRAFLNQLADGSDINVRVAVNFNGVMDKTTAVDFPERIYSVKSIEIVRPSITSVRDTKANISDGGSTPDTRLTLKGLASKGQKVEILDGTTPVGESTANEESGIWTKVVTGLSLSTHTFQAKALYGDNQQSNIWRVIVRTWPLTISVAGSTAAAPSKLIPIPDGGTWRGVYINFVGTGIPGDVLDLYNNVGNIPDFVNVRADGTFLNGAFHGGNYSNTRFTLHGVSRRTGARTNSWTITFIHTDYDE